MEGRNLRLIAWRCTVALLLALFLSACGDDGSPMTSSAPTSGPDSSSETSAGTAVSSSSTTSQHPTSISSEPSEPTTASTTGSLGQTQEPSSTGVPELPPEPWDVFEPGPYRIGFTSFERGNAITYTPRNDDEPRTFRMRVWYPTWQSEGRVARYMGLLLRRHIVQDASIAENAPEKMPLLVFSHGNSGLAEQNFFMTEYFATHGWIVISPDHTGNTFSDTQGAIDLTSGVVRPQDLSAAIDHILDLPADHFLHGRVDPERIVVSGHSFGGYTSLAITGPPFAVDEGIAECETSTARFCQILENEAWAQTFREGFLDERVKVSIPQTPGGYFVFQGGLHEITTPTLLLTGGMDATLPNEEEGDPIWSEMRGSQHIRVDFTTGGHFTFSNMCELLPVREVEDDGCSDDFMPYDEAFVLINAYSMAFARYHLDGDESHLDLLTGEYIPDQTLVFSRAPEPEAAD